MPSVKKFALFIKSRVLINYYLINSFEVPHVRRVEIICPDDQACQKSPEPIPGQFMRANLGEGDEDSNCSVSRVRRFTE